MKYLCLIYDDEKVLGKMPKPEMDAFMGEYFGFTESAKKSGHYLGGKAINAISASERAHAEAAARAEVRQAVNEYCGAQSNGGAGILICDTQSSR